MNPIQLKKNKLRTDIANLKKENTTKDLIFRSEEVLSILEITGVFQEAKTILIYNSLPDEVSTLDFIDRWSQLKDFYLPVVTDNGLVFRKHSPSASFHQSALGIYEPEGNDFIDFKKVDIVIVPGVAFDRKMNRLGRGKGYYDRFLPKISAPKIGICFDFQLLDQIPIEPTDIKMDYIISENELIW